VVQFLGPITLIGVALSGGWGPGLPNQVVLEFNEFEYRGTTFAETPGQIVLDDFREELFALYNEIGLCINAHLRSLP